MRRYAFATLILTCTLPVFAESGDAAAVIQYCGTPTSEHQGISDVTGKMQRDLSYGDLILHFVPAEDGWTFQSGWYDHLPQTEKMTEARSACFKQAMAASQAQKSTGPATAEDPTIRKEVLAPTANESTFGIPHLWLILALAVLLIVFVLVPARRRQMPSAADVEKMRQRRKPRILPRSFRRGDR